MTRGNQREQDRLKAMKKKPNAKSNESGASLAKRKLNDAEILREKQKRKDEERALQAQGAVGAGGGSSK